MKDKKEENTVAGEMEREELKLQVNFIKRVFIEVQWKKPFCPAYL
jgi:hypothetical protein